jgi:hypothetical protein
MVDSTDGILHQSYLALHKQRSTVYGVRAHGVRALGAQNLNVHCLWCPIPWNPKFKCPFSMESAPSESKI